jgi:hypothetical protein
MMPQGSNDGRILKLIVALSVIGGAAAWPLAAHAQSDVQWQYRACVNYSSNDAHAFCMTYIGGVADLMQSWSLGAVKSRPSFGEFVEAMRGPGAEMDRRKRMTWFWWCLQTPVVLGRLDGCDTWTDPICVRRDRKFVSKPFIFLALF